LAKSSQRHANASYEEQQTKENAGNKERGLGTWIFFHGLTVRGLVCTF
jgi:hypothetical protein